MGKSIRMQRDELVWETRVSYFEKEDWERIVAWLKKFDKEDVEVHSWDGHHKAIYLAVKDLSFEDVMADFEKYENNYQDDDCIYIEFVNKSYDTEETWTYQESLHDLVVEWMREDNYDADVSDSQYADDYEEYIDIIED